MVLRELVKAKTKYPTLEELGVQVGKLYTDHGLPIDMALNRLDLTKEQKVAVLDGTCLWLIRHKRNSGATEKSLQRQRKTNRETIMKFLVNDETGIY